MLRKAIFIVAVMICVGYGFLLTAQDAGTGISPPGEQTAQDVREPAADRAAEAPAEKVEPAAATKQEKKETRQTRKKEERRTEADNAAKDPAVKEESEAPPFVSKGLLMVDEGDEPLRRIPDIVLPKRRGAAEDSIVHIPGDEQQKNGEQEHRGFMGMSDDTAKTAAKVSIVILIFVIYLLYRMRSKGSRRRVVRTFPKK